MINQSCLFSPSSPAIGMVSGQHGGGPGNQQRAPIFYKQTVSVTSSLYFLFPLWVISPLSFFIVLPSNDDVTTRHPFLSFFSSAPCVFFSTFRNCLYSIHCVISPSCTILPDHKLFWIWSTWSSSNFTFHDPPWKPALIHMKLIPLVERIKTR